MNEKTKKLDELNDTVKSLCRKYRPKWKTGDPHHILYGGNTNSEIMVIQNCPEWAEVFWAKKEGKHKDFVCTGPMGHEFKSNAKQVGFQPDVDFFYTNIIPYYPLGGGQYHKDVLLNGRAILEEVISIMQPAVTVALGYPVFYALTNGEDWNKFDDMIEATHLWGYHGGLIMPLDLPGEKTERTLLMMRMLRLTVPYLLERNYE